MQQNAELTKLFIKYSVKLENGCSHRNQTSRYYMVKGIKNRIIDIGYMMKFGVKLPKNTMPFRTCGDLLCIDPDHMLEYSLAVRLSRNSKQVGECIEWTGSLTKDGYGQFDFMGDHWLAHRAAWLVVNDPIPKDLEIMHSCDNRKCINRDHMSLGTHTENMRDCMAKGRFVTKYHGTRYTGKLTTDQVREIRESDETALKICERFGVTEQTIRDIRKYRTWKQVN